MISIITAVHNQLPMNQLFYESLVRYTEEPFELIILDNASTDGSREFFADKPEVKLIANDQNYSYPYCQNQGIREASFDTLVFLNNDVIVSPKWDTRALEIMDANGLEIASCLGTDGMFTEEETRKFRNRWKRIKTVLLLFGLSRFNLRLMHQLMFLDWEKFTEKHYNKYGQTVKEGFVGFNVIAKRSAIDKIGIWDERIQAADYDIVLRTKLRSLDYGDIKPIHLIAGVYLHHYVRLTLRRKPALFADKPNLITLEEKWGEETLQKHLGNRLKHRYKPKDST